MLSQFWSQLFTKTCWLQFMFVCTSAPNGTRIRFSSFHVRVLRGIEHNEKRWKRIGVISRSFSQKLWIPKQRRTDKITKTNHLLRNRNGDCLLTFISINKSIQIVPYEHIPTDKRTHRQTCEDAEMYLTMFITKWCTNTQLSLWLLRKRSKNICERIVAFITDMSWYR